jgi:cytochrome P450
LFLFIIGGHDTISSTLAWWVKYAARYQRSQHLLREALHAAHDTARAEGRLPTAEEVAQTSVPYLEAFIEETLRYSHIAPAILRQATVDTHILGRPIPKGTDIFLNSSAASFMQPAFDIDVKDRSESARQANDERCWDSADIGDFIPERWLIKGAFDARAGPMMAFGMGRRACFGRKLVYVELRIALTLLIWRFEFLDMSALNDFAVVDSLSQRPRDCYVRLSSMT